MKKAVIAALLLLFFGASVALAQDQPKFEPTAQMKMINFPGLPDCAKGAVADGDPTKGAGVIYAKWPAGCGVPMHWHTASERLIVVSGSGTMQHEGGSAETVSKGGFVLMPSKHKHDFHCKAACEFYIVTDGAFEIHYVDASGNEIPPDQALKMKKPAGGTKKK
jgi:quercetin dioxygenase-like cupin family protein